MGRRAADELGNAAGRKRNVRRGDGNAGGNRPGSGHEDAKERESKEPEKRKGHPESRRPVFATGKE